MKIFEIKNSSESKKIKILGLTLFKTKKVGFKSIVYILGVPVFRRTEWLKVIQHVDEIKLKIDELKYNLPIQIQAATVHAYLKKYRNCNKNLDLVIVACGPSTNYYKSIKNAKHLAINKAVVFDQIKFDYSFLTDFYSTNDTNTIVDEYDNAECEKFYCLIPEKRFRDISHIPNCAQIPMSNYLRSNANIILLEDLVSHKWAREISFEPFGDFEGTVFSALQFALYTHPRTIYLVGCDETTGYFFDKDKENHHSEIINEYSISIWKKFKKFADYEYSDVEIVSINPIGLKGLFKDKYTKEYLRDHPEIQESEVIDL